MLFKCNIFVRLYCIARHCMRLIQIPILYQWTFLKRSFDILSCYVVVYARLKDNYSEGYSTIGLIVTESD